MVSGRPISFRAVRTVGIATLIVAVIGVGAYANWTATNYLTLITGAIGSGEKDIVHINVMLAEISSVQQKVEAALVGGAPDLESTYARSIDDSIVAIEQVSVVVPGSDVEDASRQSLKTSLIDRLHTLKNALSEFTVGTSIAGVMDGAGSNVHTVLTELQMLIREALRIEDLIHDELMEVQLDLVEEIRRDKLTILAISLVIVVSIFGFFIAMNKILLGYVEAIAIKTKLIAEGDFSVRCAEKNTDEIGILGRHLNKMAETLGQVTVRRDYLNQMIDALVEMLFVVTPSGRVETANRKARQLLNIANSPDPEVHLDGVFPRESGEPTGSHPLIRKLREKGTLDEVETTCLPLEGQDLPVVVSGAIVASHLPGGERYIFSCKDARDSRLVKELREKQEQIVQTAKLASLGEMSAGIAHEINNPLLVAGGSVRLIYHQLQKAHPEAATSIEQQYLAAERGLKRIENIVRHMQDFSRKSQQTATPVSLNAVVGTAIGFLGEQLKQQNITIDFEPAPGEPTIMAEANKLEQVIINCLTNSRDAILAKSGRGGGRVELETGHNPNGAFLRVSDTGCGMSEEVKERVFDPFFTTKEAGKGTGLGMSISFGLIEEFGGNIAVESTSGEGTEIRVTFPPEPSRPTA